MATVMAVPARSSSFLPTVKCSNCNAKIEISLMSDHVCSQVITVPEFHFLPLNGSFSPSFSKTSNKPSIVSPGAIQSSRSDTSAAKPPLFQPGIPSAARGPSPVTSADGRRTPFQFPPQSAIVPRRIGPSPPKGSISQDSAFPLFPTSKPRSKSPTSPSASLQSFSFPKDDFQSHTAQGHSFAPLSPRDNGGGSVLQRMDTIAPGPFQMSGKADFRLQGHRRTGTMGSSKDFTHQPIVGVGKGHFQRPSTSGSNETRKPSLSSIAGGPRSALDRIESQAPTLPTATVPLVRSQTAGVVSTESMLESDQPTNLIETLRQENRSKTYPLDNSDSRPREEGAGNALRKASEPSPHVKKLSVSAASAIRPLHEIGSISYFKPSRSIKGRGQDHVTADTRELDERTRKNEARNDDSLDDSPSVPMTTQPLKDHVGNSYHAPSESTASSGSSRSDTRSGSSTSTSPLSDSLQWEGRRPSETSQSSKFTPEFPLRTESALVGKENASPQRTALPSFSRPMYGRPKNPPLSLEVRTLVPGTAGDPAIQSGRPFPATTPDSYLGSSFSMQSGSPLLLPTLPSATAPQSPARKPKMVSKGKCRGCQEPIHGKSVSSADGRLTGRYHKRCFVCTTCKQPFRTADFYILDNQPYCGRHYHVLNGSMCMSCDHGIEGQYLETDSKQKFHPSCFTCQTCRGMLLDEYYEMNGKTYCERHAFATSPQTSLLGPGRRHPERRRTRLMMM